jgi:serine/threonine protein kinase
LPPSTLESLLAQVLCDRIGGVDPATAARVRQRLATVLDRSGSDSPRGSEFRPSNPLSDLADVARRIEEALDRAARLIDPDGAMRRLSIQLDLGAGLVTAPSSDLRRDLLLMTSRRADQEGGTRRIATDGTSQATEERTTLPSEDSASTRVQVLCLGDDLARHVDRILRAIHPGREHRPPTVALGPGSLLDGKYLLVEKLGEGGFGTVYEAVDRDLDTKVAVKLLRAELASQESALKEFRAEARRVAKLEHPHIVGWKGFNTGTANSGPYFVMELLSGRELAKVLKQERQLDVARAQRIMHQVLQALVAAHFPASAEGVLHLDLKPANVFLCSHQVGREAVKVIDFGIGRLTGRGHQTLSDSGRRRADEATPGVTMSVRPRSATSSGAISCTPEYAAPEQARNYLDRAENTALDSRTDLYSFGVMAFEMLTGELPFPPPLSRQRVDYLYLHLDEPPRNVRSLRPGVPRAIAEFVARCLQKDPDLRFEDSRTALATFEAILGTRRSALTRGLLGLGVLAVAATTAAIYASRSGPQAQFDLLYEDRSGERAALSADQPLILTDSESVALRLEGFPLDAAAQVDLGLQSRDRRPAWRIDRMAGSADRLLLHAPSETWGHLESYELRVLLEGRKIGSKALTLGALGAVPLDRLTVDWNGLALSDSAPTFISTAVPTLRVDTGLPHGLVGLGLLWIDGTLLEQPLAKTSGATTAQFSLDVPRLGLDPGEHQFAFGFVDALGRTHGPLHQRIVRLVDPTSGDHAVRLVGAHNNLDRWIVDPARIPALAIHPDRPVQVTATLTVDGGSSPSAEAASTRVAAGESSAQPLLAAWFAGLDSTKAKLSVVLEDLDVWHAGSLGEGRGRTTYEFDLWIETEPPQLNVRVDDSPLEASPPADQQPLYTSRPALQLQYFRDKLPPLDIDVRVLRDGAPLWHQGFSSDGAVFSPQFVRLPELADGHYQLQIATYRGRDSASVTTSVTGRDRTADGPLQRFDRHLVVWTIPPVLRATLSHDRWRGSDRDGPLLLTLHSDSALHGPVRLRVRNDTARPPFTDSALPPQEVELLPDRLSQVIDLTPWLSVPVDGRRCVDPDGPLELRIDGHFAGSSPVTSLTAATQLAREGPVIELLEPRREDRNWSTSEGDRVTARVRLTDPHDVASATVDLLLLDEQHPPRSLHLPLARSAGQQFWSADVRLSPDWSSRPCRLVVQAVDQDGNTSQSAPLTVEVGPVRRIDPERIELQDSAGGYTSTPMALVRADRGAGHDFMMAGKNGFELAVAAAAFPPFYLDVHEVTRGQFQAFLADSRPDDWTEERVAKLIDMAAQDPAAAPMTGVSWDEAAAYARWVGKRLQSALEWQFAAVGGARKLSWSADGELEPGEQLLHLWTEHPAAESRDRSPDGVLGLCSGAFEWTATPQDYDSAPSSTTENAPSTVARFIDPWGLGVREQYWIARGYSEDGKPDPHLFRLGSRTLPRSSFGFRCSLGVDQYHEANQLQRARRCP